MYTWKIYEISIILFSNLIFIKILNSIQFGLNVIKIAFTPGM